MAVVNTVKRATVDSITLTFDKDELTFLCTILQRIGGSPDRSLRKQAQKIVDALVNASIDIDDMAAQDQIDHTLANSNSIYFKDM